MVSPCAIAMTIKLRVKIQSARIGRVKKEKKMLRNELVKYQRRELLREIMPIMTNYATCKSIYLEKSFLSFIRDHIVRLEFDRSQQK